jgi:hypothetical protein
MLGLRREKASRLFVYASVAGRWQNEELQMSNTRSRLSIALVAALALLVFGAMPVSAQGVGGAPGDVDERHEGIGIGIKGGWLFSKFSAEGAEFDRRTGQQIGIFFGGNRPGLIGVMAEVNYGKKSSGDPEDEDAQLDLRFVSVPVVMRVNGGARSLNGVSFYGIVGPQLDWLLSQKLVIGDDEFDLEDDLGDETEGFEVSLVIGGGIEITRFIAEVRYIHGLKSIAPEFDVADATDLKSRSFAILFGFRFN